MSSEELLYVKGARIWIPHAEDVWEGAVLDANYTTGDAELKIVKDTGRKISMKIKSKYDLPPLRNPTILIGQKDLTALSYLHEPAVLHNLKVRFRERQSIYTYCGIILVAINPYAELPLYGPDIIRAYRGHSMGELEPHIFAVAEEAYTKLEREKCDLSIIVSGESGAGKTVSAKYAMRYFAAVGGSESETQVERKVLASSPIMEAFGNAKTTRNDNSSRFGKFTKLLFKNNMGVMNLTGATMQTYLLEKSRVVFQSLGERNYHIFYQLCSARAKHPELILDHQDKFKFLNKGKSPDIDRVSDVDQFKETISAMSILGFGATQISEILKILAGILHLGNIKFIHKCKKDSEEIDPDGCDIAPNDLHLHITGEMLKINAEDLRKWLITRQIESVNEYVLIPNNIAAAESAKDALAKHIYAKLFQFIVGVINMSLNSGRKQSCFIGVLDIYGFETFDSNSFEQFCINYANEKLQQQFNQHVFKLEQEEYLKEGIVWTMIDFYDNQPCIDLIESKLGVLDLLDEECRMPKGSDESWAGKLIEKCSKFKHFDKPRFGTTSFLVKHFSDTVQYDVHGFLEKNRDTVSKELVNVVGQSQMALCKQLTELEETDTLSDGKSLSLGGRVVVSASKQQLPVDRRKRVNPSKQHKRSVGSQFRESLSLLISTLHSTTPHYVRCIKPNDDKLAFKWEASKIVQQLRACGVLETVRISAAGFPSRWSYHDFYSRYQLLCHRKYLNKNDMKNSCQNIVTKWINDEGKYRFGNTQIFFRAGQVAYLEQVRANLRKKYIITVQSVVRRFIYRRRYIRLQRAMLGIQTYARGYLARQKAKEIREARAALVISKYARGYLCRRRFVKLRNSVCGIQQYARGMLARQRFKVALDNFRATQIQRFCRGYLARVAYKKRLRNIIICQSAIRRFLARRLFKRMKAEAKTISHIQKMYKGLENKIISLQQRIDELNKENTQLKLKTTAIPVLKNQLDSKKSLENELKQMKLMLIEKDGGLTRLMKQLETERDEKMQLLEEKDHKKEEWNKQKQKWRIENEVLRKQVDEMIEMAKKEEKSSLYRSRILSEVDTNEVHEAYQRALKEKNVLEGENYMLKEELSRLQKNMGNATEYTNHSRSISNASSQNEDDFGYSSAKNTLESKKCTPFESNHQTPPEPFTKIDVTSTPKSEQTSLILKLRSILEEEKKKNKSLLDHMEKLVNKHKTTEDSLRVSELEVENEKLRHDYHLLRSSINRGVEMQELEAQQNALQEELRRRRDECIQLKAVLQQQSQSLKSFGNMSLPMRPDNSFQENSELLEAFQAQKLVNRQLESELSALTEENNAHLGELSKQLDEIRNEKNQLQVLLQSGIENMDESNIESLRQNERYLRYELEKSCMEYTQLQEEMNALTKKYEDGKKNINKLTLRLHEHGISTTSHVHDDPKCIASVGKKKAQQYHGILKFNNEDLEKIFQRLIVGLTPRVAIGLLPGLPAYILFLCIRYTDFMNSETNVKLLFSRFVIHMKKIHRMPNMVETRVLWLVNSLTLHNLLKQYGGIEEYIRLNTAEQNQQQLKNFDLSEYRRVIYEIIVNLYQSLVQQIQGLIKSFIVPAVLDHDEIQRGHGNHGNRRTMSLDSSPEHAKISAPKLLVNQLEHYYKQFHYFGLHLSYTEQIFCQMFYYICAIAMNTLMLRGDICMWETGMKIRYNVTCLEDWVREKKMSTELTKPLAPLIDVSQLLQSRKTEQDVDSVYELCNSLTTAQVLKMIKSYNSDDCEREISNTFVEKLTQKLNKRNKERNNEFTMDQEFIQPFKVVYNYSDVKLEDIELPKQLHLDELLTKI